MYNEMVLQHFNNPRNVGEIENADGIGIYMSEFCGDITKFWIRIKENRIIEATYRTKGCAASIACGSILTELVKNLNIEEVLMITKNHILSALKGLPEKKIHCSVLADDALKDAIRDYLSRNLFPVPTELVEKQEKIKPLLKKMKERGQILI
ncbi:MAG: iron-sulfur cluster assembly scaffold protein [Candidatus Bathyarchaeota archaeon]|nr:MAG: iron-sulfur cluster assembly scaffold protein [Candidatus Bathyarchaeota archaeon]